MKQLPLIALFLGEILIIIAELFGARIKEQQGSISIGNWVWLLAVGIVSAICLIYGYIEGTHNYGNIWFMMAVSVCSILLIEPILAYLLFRHPITLGTGLGLSLGFLGLIITLVIK